MFGNPLGGDSPSTSPTPQESGAIVPMVSRRGASLLATLLRKTGDDVQRGVGLPKTSPQQANPDFTVLVYKTGGSAGGGGSNCTFTYRMTMPDGSPLVCDPATMSTTTSQQPRRKRMAGVKHIAASDGSMGTAVMVPYAVSGFGGTPGAGLQWAIVLKSTEEEVPETTECTQAGLVADPGAGGENT